LENRGNVGYIRLIHWKKTEAQERASRLRALGYRVVSGDFDRDAMRAVRENPPQAAVIDLSRLPSHGRDVAIGLRSYKATRHVPLVFVEGDPPKVKLIQALLPDAIYTTWEKIAGALEEAIVHPPMEPVVPGSVMDAYAGTPLPDKLGIKAGTVICLAGAPVGFEATLGDLPPGATVQRSSDEHSDLTLWFTTSRGELEEGIAGMADRAEKGGLWIIWPKKSSGVESDLSQTVVRQVALAARLVDFKVCSVDQTWSGLRFARKKAPAP
jgi:CheY-like chemotaxis protein